MLELLGTDQFFDADDLAKLIFRMILDVGFTFILVHFVYKRATKTREYTFAFFMLNFITFSICILLRKVPVDLGFALGLFAVFGILRYRTKPIEIRDLTYLFIVIGIAILNAVANRRVSLGELLFVNTVIVSMAAVIDLRKSVRRERSRPARYDNLALLAPDKRAELVDDLKTRTGLDVQSVLIERIDLLRDSAELTIIYNESPGGSS
jgi:hypothetical protein